MLFRSPDDSVAVTVLPATEMLLNVRVADVELLNTRSPYCPGSVTSVVSINTFVLNVIVRVVVATADAADT